MCGSVEILSDLRSLPMTSSRRGDTLGLDVCPAAARSAIEAPGPRGSPPPAPAVGARARDDARLAREIASGSVDALEEIYRRYGPRALRVARTVCRDECRAEEAVQDAFSSVWRSQAGAYRSQRGTVAAWLMAVVRYRALDAERRNVKHATHRAEEAMIAFQLAPGDLGEQQAARADAAGLQAVIKRLPYLQREVITLAFYGQLTHAEIAARLELPSGTVKGRMRLGLQKLRADIEQVEASARHRDRCHRQARASHVD
jgi:RNA polymerase sigma-70 factor (ECF subfamily)